MTARRADHLRIVVAVFAAVVAATACGSTVPVGAGASVAVEDSAVGMAGPAADGMSLPVTGDMPAPAVGAPVTTTGQQVTDGTVESANAPPLAPGQAPPGADGSARPPRADSPQVAMGRGVTTDTITVGFEYYENVQAASQAIVGADFGNPDPVAYQRAVVTDINRRGGLYGRKIRVIEHGYDSGTTSTEEDDRNAEAACAKFTQDHEVFAVLSTFDHVTDNFDACLTKGGVAHVNVAAFGGAAGRVRANPSLVAPANLDLTRVARVTVEGLAANGFFDGDVKIGLLRVDTPSIEEAARDGTKRALARLGLRLDAEEAVPPNLSGGSAQASAAVLRFRQAGIDRVLFIVPSGLGPIVFGNAAESQGYRPRYGLSSLDQPIAAADTVPPEQLVGSRTVGWLPLADIHDYRKRAPNGVREACFKQLARHGIPLDGLSPEYAAAQTCELFSFFQHALAQTPGDLTLGGFVGGVDRLGTTFRSALTFGTRLQPGKHAGAAAYRPGAYVTACSCFRYTGPAVDAAR